MGLGRWVVGGWVGWMLAFYLDGCLHFVEQGLELFDGSTFFFLLLLLVVDS